MHLIQKMSQYGFSPVECGSIVKQMVKHRLVTKQTPPEGVEVQKVRFLSSILIHRLYWLTFSQVMVAEALDIARETYLAILLDRAYGGAVLMGSPMGGVDIEEVAENHPDQIFTVIDPIFLRNEKNCTLTLFLLVCYRSNAWNEKGTSIGHGTKTWFQRQSRH